jgi:hypothetical protein
VGLKRFVASCFFRVPRPDEEEWPVVPALRKLRDEFKIGDDMVPRLKGVLEGRRSHGLVFVLSALVMMCE